MATLIRGETSFDCALVAWQMLLKMGREELIGHLGHDGSEMVDGVNPRGFHMQEFLPIALKANLRPMYVEYIPSTIYPGGHVRPITSLIRFFHDQISTRFGVLECKKIGRPVAHAVYFEKGIIYDPSGFKYSMEAMKDFAELRPIGAYVC